MLKLDLNPKPHVLRQFAFAAVPGLLVIAWFVLRLCGAFSVTHPAMLVAALVGVGQLGLFLLGIRVQTRLLFGALLIVAFPIGFVLSHVLMVLIYLLVITPIALIFRLIGRDVLGRKLDSKQTSYWHVRATPRDAASYFKLY
jgi:hypothetical protein